MITPKRIAEMKVLLERRGVSDTGDAAAYRVALRDAIAEIEELQARLVRGWPRRPLRSDRGEHLT